MNMDGTRLPRDATRQGMTHAHHRLALDQGTLQERRDAIARETTAEQRAFAVGQGQRLSRSPEWPVSAAREAFSDFVARTPGLGGASHASLQMEAAPEGLDLDIIGGLVGARRLGRGGDPNAAVLRPEAAPRPETAWTGDLGTHVGSPQDGRVPQSIAGAE